MQDLGCNLTLKYFIFREVFGVAAEADLTGGLCRQRDGGLWLGVRFPIKGHVLGTVCCAKGNCSPGLGTF